MALKQTDPVPEVKPPTPLAPCQLMQAEVAKFSDWDINIVQAIAQAENRACDPLRHNETASETHRRADGSVICIGSYGALQVGCLHYTDSESRDNLKTNIAVAHRVYTGRKAKDGVGYTAWTQYTNGMYKQFLKAN